MTNSESGNSVQVFFTHEFKRNLRQLAKKYRRIQGDLESVFAEIQTGNLPGERIPGLRVEVYKARVANSDSAKGKSGGYRIIYQRKTDTTIVLVTVYSKTEQEDISVREIQEIIQQYEQGMVENELVKDEIAESGQPEDAQEHKDTTENISAEDVDDDKT